MEVAMPAFPFLALLALALFLAFAASGITWLISSVTPGAIATGRRQVGLVAIVTGALLAVVLFTGAILAPQRPGRVFFPPRPPVPGQQAPGQPQPVPFPTPTR
jgi:hypothetical protein